MHKYTYIHTDICVLMRDRHKSKSTCKFNMSPCFAWRLPHDLYELARAYKECIKTREGGERERAEGENRQRESQAKRTVCVGSRQVASHSELIGRRSSLQFPSLPPAPSLSLSLTRPHCHSKFKLNFHTLKLVGKVPNRH